KSINEKEQYFFFASRRRHTRSKRDWSSDVCSSDLDLYRYSNKDTQSMQMYRQSFNAASKLKLWPIMRYNAGELYKLYEKSGDYRSEERRVGKESRDASAKYLGKKINEQ